MAYRSRIVGHGSENPEQLLANPNNFRIHPRAQEEALAGVLSEVGWVDEVLVNQTTGFVVDGHLRVAHAISQGEKSVPVTYLDLTEEEEGKVIASFDPITAMAVTDQEKLDELLAGLSVEDQRLGEFLATLGTEKPKDLGEDMADLTPPSDPITQPGDLWLLGEHRLLCGDSTKREDVERLMGGERADMVFTDPPYGVDYDGGSGNTEKRERMTNDDRDIYRAALPMFDQVSHDTAALYLWFADRRTRGVATALEDAGWDIRALLIWNKLSPHYGAFMAQYMQRHEPFFYAHKRGQSPVWYGPTNEVTVWDVEQPTRSEFHPTQKPVELAARAIRNSSRSDDCVLDLFAGSGSTMIAAQQLDRRCYAMEISSAYCDVVVRRWETLTGRKATLEQSLVAIVP